MSRTIDEKVVEMRFDNSQFERNVSTTISTLGKLKNSLRLDGASKGLEEIDAAAKNVNMSFLGEGVEAVKAKFSALEIIGITALSNITNSAINSGKALVKSLSVDQITAGWNKYEQKTASVQTIMNATGKSIDEVNGYLDKLMWYSDETSYGFTDMTSALATMTSAGGDIDRLIPMIMGVANATAFAGKGASEFSRLMQFGINQAYSLGYMQVQDWKSIEGATVNSKQLQEALISAGEALGKIKKGEVTLSNFRSSLKDAWLDKDVMESGFGKFAELTEAAYKAVKAGEFDTASEAIEKLAKDYDEVAVKAFRSAQEAKSFTEAIEATKDAVSSGWMKTSELIFGNYEEAKTLWTDLANTLWDVFASGAEDRNEMLTQTLTNPYKQLLDMIENAGYDASEFEKHLIKHFRNSDAPIDELLHDLGSMDKALRHIDAKTIADNVSKAFQTFVSGKKGISDVTDKLEDFQNVVNRVINGEFKTGQARYKALDEAGYNHVVVQKLVNMVWERNGKSFKNNKITVEELTEAMKGLSSEELESVGYTEEEIEKFKELIDVSSETGEVIHDLVARLGKPTGRELLIDSVKKSFKALMKIMNAVKSAWSKVFPKTTAEMIYGVLEAINKFTDKLLITNQTADKIEDTFVGLFTIVKKVKDIFVKIISVGTKLGVKVFKPLADFILDCTSALGRFISKGSDTEKKVFKPMNSGLETVGNFVSRFTKYVSENFGKATESISKSIDEWRKKIEESELFKKCSEYFEEGSNAIQNALSGIKEKMDNFDFSVISKKIQKVGNVFSNIGNTLLNSNLISSFVDDVKNALSTLWNYIKGFKLPEWNSEKFTNTFGKFLDFLEKNNYSGIKGGIIGSLAFLKQQLKYKLDGIQTSALEKFSNFWLKHGTNIEEGWKKAKQVVKSISKFLIGSEEITLPAILDTIKKFLEIAVLMKAMNIFSNLTGTVESISEAFENITKSLKWKAVGQSFKAMAIALGIFGVCLIVINQMGVEKALAASTVLLGILVTMGIIIAALMSLAGDLKGGLDFIAVSTALVGMALGLGILVATLKAIDQLDFRHVFKSWLIMSGILISLALSIGIIGKFAGGATIKSVAAILTMLTSLKMILSILQEYSEYPWDDVSDAIPKLGIALFSLAAALRLATGGIKEGANTAGLAMLLLAMILSLKILLSVIKEFVKMDENDLWKKGIAPISVILVVMGIMLNKLKDTSPTVVQKGQKVANMYTGLVMALLGVVAAILVLGNLPLDILVQGGLAVGAILLLFSVMMVSFGKANFAKAKKGTVLLSMILLAAIIGEVAVIIKLLSNVDWKTSVGLAVGMSIMLMAMAECLTFLSERNIKSKNIYKWIGSMAVLAAVLAELGLVLGLMKWFEIDGTNAILQFTALSIILYTMADVLRIMMTHSKVKADNIYKWITAISLLGLVAFELTFLLVILKAANVDGKEAIGHVVALSLMLYAIAGLIKICSLIGPSATAAYPAMGAIGVFVAELTVLLTAIVSAFGYLSNVTNGGFEKTIEAGVKIVKLLGEAIGGFFGSIVKGFSEQVSSALPQIGEDLSGFMNNAKDFFDGLERVNGDMLAKAGFLTGIIGVLAPESALNGLLNFLTIGGEKHALPQLGKDLGDFMKNAEPFFTTLGDIPESAVGGASALAEALTSLAAASLTNSIGDLISFGKNDFDWISSAMAQIAKGIVNFASLMDEEKIDSQRMARVKDAVDIMADIVTQITTYKGSFNKLDDLKTFSTDLEEFGSAITTFSLMVSTDNAINIDKISKVKDAALIIGDMVKELPPRESWLNTVTDLGGFSEDIEKFGRAILGFSSAVSVEDSIDVNKISRATLAGGYIAEMAKKIPQSKHWWSDDFGNFSTDLPLFGSGIIEFYNAISGTTIDSNKVSVACTAGAQIANMAAQLPEKSTWFNDVTDLDEFGNQLKKYGKALAEFVSSLGGITDYSQIANAVEQSNKLAEFFKDISKHNFAKGIEFFDWLLSQLLGTMSQDISIDSFTSAIDALSAIDVDSIIKAFEGSAPRASEAATKMFGAFVTSAKIKLDSVKDLANSTVKLFCDTMGLRSDDISGEGKKLLDTFKNGFSNNIASIIAAVNAICAKIVEIFDQNGSKFYDAGNSVVDGFANGITENVNKVEAAAKAMADASYSATTSALDINSPSKRFRSMAECVPEGFAQGIDKLSGVVKKSSENMANLAYDTTYDALSKIGDIANDDKVIRPTISPVIDMDSISSSELRLGASIDATIGGPVSTLSQLISRAQRDINDSNDELIRVINGLRQDLNDLYSEDDTEIALYVDSKKLATSLVKPMNRQLNILSQRGAY